MPINQVLLERLNNQFDLERENNAFYLAMHYALENINWEGSAKFMNKQASEEAEHASLFGHYIIDRGEAPTFASIDPVVPPSGDDLLPFFEAALAREQATTESLKELYFLAEKMGDPQTCSFLECPSNGFVGFFAEQTKSEREIIDIIIMLRRLDNNGRVFYDEQIGQL